MILQKKMAEENNAERLRTKNWFLLQHRKKTCEIFQEHQMIPHSPLPTNCQKTDFERF